MITVFTPTYNRAHTLQRLYDSLCNQKSYNFEWIIVDDGSVDNTEMLVNGFRKKSLFFDIIYHKQKNGGKHRAINKGVSLAKGDFFFIVDSDDYLTNDAITFIERQTELLKDDINYCGIVGLKCYENHNIVGGGALIIDTDFLSYRIKYKIKGDRAEIVKTSVMKEFPFPEFEGEYFCTEALVWNRISQKYKARYLDMKIYVCEYLPGGLTSVVRHLLYANPQGISLYYFELSSYKIPIWLKIKSAVNFWRYYLRVTTMKVNVPMWIYIFYLPGGFFCLLDKLKRYDT